METALWLDQVTIRQLTREDLPALEWEGEYTHFRRVYADAFERARTGRSILWVAEFTSLAPTAGIYHNHLNEVIGQLFVQLTCDRPELADGIHKGYIYAFRVKPFFRAGGLGSRMLKTAEDDLKQRGFKTATLNVAQVNRDARRLYERLGYHVVAADPGRWSYPDEKGYWRFVEEPAWRMEKAL
jgi:ribosomal protein S18 acetylase RimI-like enzyme